VTDLTDNMLRWLRFLDDRPGACFELQTINPRKLSVAGDAEHCAVMAQQQDGKCEAVYVVANRLDDARVNDLPTSWTPIAQGQGTKSDHVSERRVLYLDIDADRPRIDGKSPSATDVEVQAAHEVAVRLHTDLASVLGADCLGFGHSGNGRAVLVALDYLPETPELHELVKRIVLAAKNRYSTDAAHVDGAVHEAKRLMPAFGTLKCKGRNTQERPHRRSSFTCADDVQRVGLDQLQRLLTTLQPQVAQEQPSVTQKEPRRERLDATSWLHTALDAAGRLGRPLADGQRVVACPWAGDGEGQHAQGAETSTVLFSPTTAGPARFHCSHETCHGRTEADVRNALPVAAVALADEVHGVRVQVPSVVADPWQTLHERGIVISERPPKRRWLLKVDGEGALPLGKAGVLASGGGTGKTTVLVQLALAVATGKPWLDIFDVCTPGNVLLALGEEDIEEVHRRMHRAGAAMGLSANEALLAAQRIVALPLAGVPVALTAKDQRGNTSETQVLDTFRRQLAQRDWSLIILDPFARFAGDGSEVDNAAATRAVQAFESLARSPGSPAVIVAHHSSQTSLQDGKPNVRGATAIVDGFRWATTMIACAGELNGTTVSGVKLTLHKTNYTRKWPDKYLVWTEDRVPVPARDGGKGQTVRIGQDKYILRSEGSALVPAKPDVVAAFVADKPKKEPTTGKPNAAKPSVPTDPKGAF